MDTNELPLLPGSPPADGERPARAVFQEVLDRLASSIVAPSAVLDQLALTGVLHLRGVGGRLLVTGPTGSGKTHTAVTLARALGVAWEYILATEIVEVGWSGVSLGEHLSGWASDVGAQAAERGVLIVDELCKIRIHRESHGNAPDKYRGQQSALLGLLGGSEVAVHGGGERLSTSGMTVICCGAFSDAAWSRNGRPPTSAELTSYGLISELSDRLTERIALRPAAPSELARIYAADAAGSLGGVARLAEGLGYTLRVDPAAYQYVANATFASRGGVGPRTGGGWLLEAAKRLLAAALREGVAEGSTLTLTPDDITLPGG